MPRTIFFNFLQAVIGFFQWMFAAFTRSLAPLFRLSPLPDSVDLFLVCLVIAGLVFAIFQSRPWDR